MPKYYDLVNNTGGRPYKKINEEGKRIATLLAGLMCTDEEIASELDMSCDCLHNPNNKEAFEECKEKGQSRGKTSLRRYQFKLAEKNANMAIWLGKQYLGQRDNIEVQDKDLTRVEELLTKIKEEANDAK